MQTYNPRSFSSVRELVIIWMGMLLCAVGMHKREKRSMWQVSGLMPFSAPSIEVCSRCGKVLK
jgi:hypothetical protein